MKWNDPKIIEAVSKGLKEFSSVERESPTWHKLDAQLTYVIQMQEGEKNDK